MEYRDHLKVIVYMVLAAENAVMRENPDFWKRLTKVSKQEQIDGITENCYRIADEIISKTPKDLMPDDLL